MPKRIAAGAAIASVMATSGAVVADGQINPYEDRGAHYELPITSDIPQGEKVFIAKDKAAMTLTGWRGEYAITIEPQIPATKVIGSAVGEYWATSDGRMFAEDERAFTARADRALFSKRMEYKDGDVTAFIEPLSDTEFDIDFTLDSEPDTNVFEYRITGAEDFDFFYQPPLTQEEIDEGAERPENVVGSYAVYHKTKANHRTGSTNYATGKVMHIYRPKAIDADGNEAWAKLDYSNGILSVIVPQKFLNSAVYPVTVDPTFGYTTAGASWSYNAGDRLYSAQEVDPGESGTMESVSYYLKKHLLSKNSIGGLYLGSDVSFIESGSTVYITSSTGAWYTSTGFSSSITSQNYLPAVIFDASSGSHAMYIAYDTGSTLPSIGVIPTYPTFPDPSSTSENTTNRSVYATYTAGGGGGGAAPAPAQDVIWFD